LARFPLRERGQLVEIVVKEQHLLESIASSGFEIDTDTEWTDSE
jgi:hypothetical protein